MLSTDFQSARRWGLLSLIHRLALDFTDYSSAFGHMADWNRFHLSPDWKGMGFGRGRHW